MKVLIVGGGIAGPAAAIALAKAGIASEVYEAYPAGADSGTGAFLVLTANGQDALHAIDAGQQVEDLSFPTTRLRLLDSAGRELADVPMGSERPPSRSIKRAALSRALRSIAVTRRIPVLYGKRLVSASPGSDGGVTAVFDDGTTATGDLLIGADGAHSPVRSLIDPAAPAPRYTGLVIASGYAPPQPGATGPDGYSMYFGSRAFLGCTLGPDDLTWWFARIPASQADASRLAASGDLELLARPFDGDATPAAGLIRASSTPLTVTEADDIAHLPTWSANGMIVIGDAAHPVSPMTTQGASLAIEDAAILARCLRDVSPIPDALRVYETLRRERVEEVARSGASGENPAPPAPGSRTGPRPSPVLDHHIDWDAPVRNILLPKTDSR
jgi:2-polyprenyl-6-methoxyphenol hydroxylase-like FAD-dependent oxidoreductase